MRKCLAVMAVALSLSVAPPAMADVVCAFNVSGLWMTPEGAVSVSLATASFGKSYWLCSVAGSTTVNDGYSSKPVTSDTCRAMYSTLLTAKVTSRPISLQFHGPADCSNAALPADGTQPAPYPANFGLWQ